MIVRFFFMLIALYFSVVTHAFTISVDILNNELKKNYLFVERSFNQSDLKIETSSGKILFDQGFVLNYQFINDTTQGSIKIALKYNQITKEPVIKKIERVSKPGLRRYSSISELPRVLNGLGVNIVSTSKGLMTGKKAKRENLGGEIICNVY